jgi:hypothetical protein
MSIIAFIYFGVSILLAYIVSLVIAFAILIVPFSITIFINYTLLKKFYIKRNYFIQITFIFSILAILVAAYQTYRAYFPADSFYWDEYFNITQMKKPISGKIIHKAADYPDMHGDYCSCAFIQLSEKDYSNLLDNIKKDSNMIIGKPEWSYEFKKVMKYLSAKEIRIGFIRPIKENEDISLYVGFFKDGNSIIIHRSSS